MHVNLTALTMAEHFRDDKVLLFISNIFRFVQGGSSPLLDRIPSAVDLLSSTLSMLQKDYSIS